MANPFDNPEDLPENLRIGPQSFTKPMTRVQAAAQDEAAPAAPAPLAAGPLSSAAATPNIALPDRVYGFPPRAAGPTPDQTAMTHTPSAKPWEGPLFPAMQPPSLGLKQTLAQAAPQGAQAAPQAAPPPGAGSTPDVRAAVSPAVSRGGMGMGNADSVVARQAATAPAVNPRQTPGYGGGAPLAQGPVYQSAPTASSQPDTTVAEQAAPWAAANRAFDDRKMGQDLLQYQMLKDVDARAQATTASLRASQIDLPNAQTSLKIALSRGNPAEIAAAQADVARLSGLANGPIAAGSDMPKAFAETQQGLSTAAERENRTALAASTISKQGAEVGLTKAQTASEKIKQVGFTIDNEGKVIDNQGKVAHTDLIRQQIASAKTDQEAKALLSSLVSRRASATNPAEIANLDAALLAAHGKAGEEWKVQHMSGGMMPDPTNPGMQIKEPDRAILWNSRTGEMVDAGAPSRVTATPKLSKDQALAAAKQAIAQGKDRDAVNARLREMGHPTL